MPFKIKKGIVSGHSWGDVDKSSIWQRLKKGLEEGADGVREAIREMYAVVKADINADLTQADCWGPHHEIQQDGSLVLNRGGLIAATAARAGARSEPDLTSAQRKEAAQHLMRHYREIEGLEPPESLAQAAGEMVRLTANVTGEMRVEDVPLASRVDLAAIKAGDDDPLEVVVEVPAGKSRRGWNYLPQTLQKIVGEVMANTATGFLGHQKPEDVDHQFLPPVTHWVGAKWENGKAYFRGVVDAAAKDLKRWIRAGRVKQVSIFGVPTLKQAAGETQVTDYRLLSIDWTPLDRAGMPTSVVAVGEMMDSIVGGDYFNNYRYGGGKMSITELLAELRKVGVKPGQVIGEMGWDVKTLAKELGWELDKVAGEISAEGWSKLQATMKAMGEMAESFGLGKDVELGSLVKAVKEAREVQEKVSGELAGIFGLAKDAKLADVITAAKTAREAQQKMSQDEHNKLVDKVVGEMVTEGARPIVKMLLQVKQGATEDEVKKAVGEMLEREDVKKSFSLMYKDPVIAPKVGRQENNSGGLRIKRVTI